MPSISLIRRKLQGFVLPENALIPPGIDLRSALATNSTWERARFVDSRFGVADFSRSRFLDVVFSDCAAPLAQMGGCSFEGCAFVDCDLEQAVFVGSVFRDVQFVRCRLAYSSFAGATLRDGIHFNDCNMHGADVDFLENHGAVFEHCNLWGAKASLGCQFYNSEFDARTCDRFTAMVARLHPDPVKRAKLEELAGRELGPVKRLMDRRIPEEGAWPKPEEKEE